MYALKIELNDGKLQTTPASGPDGSRKHVVPEDEQVEDVEAIPVSVGNPRVEHISGIVHLYRESGPNAPGSSAPALPVL